MGKRTISKMRTMNTEYLEEMIRQVIEGRDFSPSEKLLMIDKEVAYFIPAGNMYSIATYVWHCNFWNQIWLARLLGEKRLSDNDCRRDWFVPLPADWNEVRETFLSNLNLALKIASSKPFEHKMKDDDVAAKTLCQIAVHTAYHVGQVQLLKRMIGEIKQKF